jgi:hypothetical protein
MNITAPQYHSPAVRYDPLAQVEIVQRLDPESGKVISQTPTEETVTHARNAALDGSSASAAAALVKPLPAVPSTGSAKSVVPSEPEPEAETATGFPVHPPISLLV